jgi:predicted O-methyltransferase YrrM
MNPASLSVLNSDVLDRLRHIQRQTAQIQGWLSPQAGGMLYLLARFFAPNASVVELGAWKGRSTVWLASAIKDRGQGCVYSVDTWFGTPSEQIHQQLLRDYGSDDLYREFQRNLERVRLTAQVSPLRMTTMDAAIHWSGSPIGMLLIDADHSYGAVKADFDHWSSFVMPGGFIVFDDVPSWPGPTRVVSRLPEVYEWVAAPPSQWIVKKGDADGCRPQLQDCLEVLRRHLPRKQRPGRWRKYWGRLLNKGA